MKTVFINRTKKVVTLPVQSVRAFVKKNGYSVGSWYANGRISGMSNFSCGDLEIKEKQLDFTSEFVMKDLCGEKLGVTTHIVTVAVEVKSWNKEVDMKKVAKKCESNGWKVSDVSKDSFVVTK